MNSNAQNRVSISPASQPMAPQCNSPFMSPLLPPPMDSLLPTARDLSRGGSLYNTLPSPHFPRLPQSEPVAPAYSYHRMPIERPAVSRRIPRPPNAFILYRSESLREIKRMQREMPQVQHHETKQQVLSRVIGESWQIMSQEERDVWHAKAAKVQADHQLRYPGYKFTPSPRGPPRPKKKRRGSGVDHESVTSDKARIRSLREKYLQVAGPAVTPPRRKRTKAKKEAVEASIPVQATLPPALSLPDHGGIMPQMFPQPSYPHIPDYRLAPSESRFSSPISSRPTSAGSSRSYPSSVPTSPSDYSDFDDGPAQRQGAVTLDGAWLTRPSFNRQTTSSPLSSRTVFAGTRMLPFQNTTDDMPNSTEAFQDTLSTTDDFYRLLQNAPSCQFQHQSEHYDSSAVTSDQDQGFAMPFFDGLAYPGQAFDYSGYPFDHSANEVYFNSYN
ncbi:hypothetical protein C8J56DRAFT_553703 [Mycena floridula]|nr:hypothetical protein C8J56DRAFT_553703 [Mycena floridula]